MQSFPIVPFSLNTTYPSLLYFAANGVSEGCDFTDRILGARDTREYMVSRTSMRCMTLNDVIGGNDIHGEVVKNASVVNER